MQKDLRLRRKISQIVFKSSRIRKHYSIKDRRKQKVDVEVVFAHRQTFSEALIFSSPNYFPITYLSGKLKEKYTHRQCQKTLSVKVSRLATKKTFWCHKQFTTQKQNKIKVESTLFGFKILKIYRKP